MNSHHQQNYSNRWRERTVEQMSWNLNSFGGIPVLESINYAFSTQPIWDREGKIDRRRKKTKKKNIQMINSIFVSWMCRRTNKYVYVTLLAISQVKELLYFNTKRFFFFGTFTSNGWMWYGAAIGTKRTVRKNKPCHPSQSHRSIGKNILPFYRRTKEMDSGKKK